MIFVCFVLQIEVTHGKRKKQKKFSIEIDIGSGSGSGTHSALTNNDLGIGGGRYT